MLGIKSTTAQPQEKEMNQSFELAGPLTSLSSYPSWMQDIVAECAAGKEKCVTHELFQLMRVAELDQNSTANFLIGIWPVIERFPGYMALSLLKTRFGRSPADDLARRWLVRNIRVEQNHAEYWLKWAEGEGIARNDVLHQQAPEGTQTLANWLEEVCTRDSLAASVAASNYAVEGVAGEWAKLVFESKVYQDSFPDNERKATLRWLELHAEYDDVHPWEALEIVCTAMGSNPKVEQVTHIHECIKRTYTSQLVSVSRCLEHSRPVAVAAGAVA